MSKAAEKDTRRAAAADTQQFSSSPAKIIADRKHRASVQADAEKRQHRNKLTAARSAKSYINRYATKADLLSLMDLIQSKLDEMD